MPILSLILCFTTCKLLQEGLQINFSQITPCLEQYVYYLLNNLMLLNSFLSLLCLSVRKNSK